ncbi:hypothetical protein V6N13_138191 [Hibiscus sabdariffa]|uniref:Uncharacterized protein n=1 Tax=Hibiscus sabdariffa TaxID=183260 RepID=A0ABR2QCQ4_9ROSI
MKHRRSTSEFSLAKGDGWLKDFEGWRTEANNDGNQGTFGAFIAGLYAHFKWWSYFVHGSMLWWRSSPVSVESLGAYHDFILLADLIIWFHMRFLSLSICNDWKVGEEDVGAFSSVEKDWVGSFYPLILRLWFQQLFVLEEILALSLWGFCLTGWEW